MLSAPHEIRLRHSRPWTCPHLLEEVAQSVAVALAKIPHEVHDRVVVQVDAVVEVAHPHQHLRTPHALALTRYAGSSIDILLSISGHGKNFILMLATMTRFCVMQLRRQSSLGKSVGPRQHSSPDLTWNSSSASSSPPCSEPEWSARWFMSSRLSARAATAACPLATFSGDALRGAWLSTSSHWRLLNDSDAAMCA